VERLERVAGDRPEREIDRVKHSDHVALLRDGVTPGGVWADLGSGEDAFTLALADLVGPEGRIYSVEKDADALENQSEAMARRFPRVAAEYVHGDFTKPLDLPPLDGIVMANSLHFYRDKETLVRRLVAYLKDGGHFVLVEYDADRGNPWVPHPLSYATWDALSLRAGLADTRRIGRVPSRFLGAIYSALSVRAS
jgi:ubiquinone/menaquinone biosynthesis C-methylase UbiE